MNGVSFPIQVAVLLRRLANVFSTLSISKHYFSKAQERLREDELGNSTATRDEHSANAAQDKPQSYQLPDPFHNEPERKPKLDVIHQLLVNTALYDPLRVPRFPLVLCHGLYGFDNRGPSAFPSMRMVYWANVLNILRKKMRAEVMVTSVPSTGSIEARAKALNEQLQQRARGRDINFIAHSMGGLDCRHLISHLKPTEYAPLSLLTIATPHRGSPFMDWCAEYIGLGKLAKEAAQKVDKSLPEDVKTEDKGSKLPLKLNALSSLPSSFTTLLLSILDSPAYANLTSTYLNKVFNPVTPDDPNVKYFSVAGRLSDKVNIWHPFWLPQLVLDGVESKERQRLKEVWQSATREEQQSNDPPLWARDKEWGNDGLVTVQSAKWGEFLGVMEGCDHWELRGSRGIEFGVDLPAIPAIGLDSVSSQGVEGWGWLIKSWKKEETERQKSGNEDPGATDKLSAVFDWISEQVPAPPLLGSKTKAVDTAKEQVDSAQQGEKVENEGKRNELGTKMDLERFYVALARKLYDEGL